MFLIRSFSFLKVLELAIDSNKINFQIHQSFIAKPKLSAVNINIYLKFRQCRQCTYNCSYHFIQKSTSKKQSEWFYYEYAVFVHYNAHDFHIHEDTYVVNFRMNNFLLIFFCSFHVFGLYIHFIFTFMNFNIW